MWWLPLLLACREPIPLVEESCDACDGACEIAAFECASANHVEGGLTYADGPPTCGDHDPCWTTWGVHASDPGDEHWVHNLEHGGVVFLYDCPDGCDDDVAALTDLVGELPSTILTPYANMPRRFAVVAWGHRWMADCVDVDAMRAFYDDHFDQAPESVAAMPPESCMP